MQRLQSIFYWAMVSSQLGHIFCCGLPAVISLISLLSGLGIVAAVPLDLAYIHELLHDYEVPLIVFSGFMIVVGWSLHSVSERLDCHSTGCVHGSCTPKKKRSTKVLVFATLLFVMNIVVFLSADHGHGSH